MLNDHQIVTQASLLTIEVVKAKGLTQSDYMYSEIENTLFQAKQSNQHVITIGWPDGIYCFISSTSPIELQDLAPEQLKAAYRQSYYDSNRTYDLG